MHHSNRSNTDIEIVGCIGHNLGFDFIFTEYFTFWKYIYKKLRRLESWFYTSFRVSPLHFEMKGTFFPKFDLWYCIREVDDIACSLWTLGLVYTYTSFGTHGNE